MLQFELAFPLHGEYEGRTWRITEPFLKLALKYGMVGKWKHDPWTYFNLSVAFDAYSMTRGPARGLPDLRDFAASMMMGSGVDGNALPRFLCWLALPETGRDLEAVREAILPYNGLHHLPSDSLKLLANFADTAINDRERLKGISLARIYKWLSAWASAHVPMIDSEVHNALTGYYPDYWLHPSELLLQRFQAVVVTHAEVLTELGSRVAAAWPECFLAPMPPVRVLDNLIWFDWRLEAYSEDFREYIVPDGDGDHHQVTDLGRQFLRRFGF